MTKAECNIRIGTSGWYYDHWKELFYPPGLPKNKWFEHYVQHFDTVEINNTFYHLPKETSLQRWHKQAPKNFLYAVKANRYITHIKRLKDTSEEVERFSDRISLLKSRLGPILYQLPPSLHKDLDLLESFIKLLPRRRIAVFEFRHESWFSEDTFKLLNKFGIGFCVHDLVGKETPRVVTADIIYIRFHGPTGKYEGNYSKSALKNWADWIKDNCTGISSVFAYFNNDVGGHAIGNAKTLRGQLRC
ncbi:MAG: DUF72 domain-containing protein [Planctomycetota bacterium]|jgi:uncharacterized protein YecE (DUF72 family)